LRLRRLMQQYLTRQFELSRGGGAHNVRPMEGLRGFAVSLVFLVHYVTLVKPWISSVTLITFANAIHTLGNAGVDLFFVLSGYLIYGSLISRPQNFLKFMSRRVIRLYPVFIVVFVAYLALSFIFPAESKIPSPIGSGLIYLVANFLLLPGLLPIEPMITVAWSLSYEMFYYLAIPPVIAFFNLRQRSSAWRVWFFSAAAIGAATYCAVFGGHIRLTMFISGVLLHEALAGRKWLHPGGFVGLLALAVGLLSTLLPMPGSTGSAIKVGILFCAFFLLCMACFQDSLAPLPRAFSWTPLRWLGNMSYSYYLVHGLTLKAIFLVLAVVMPASGNGGSLIFWGLLPIMFALTLIPAAALFLVVERPFSLAPKANPGSLIGHPARRSA
jgi:exopolysaccharide production protein ExoZ